MSAYLSALKHNLKRPFRIERVRRAGVGDLFRPRDVTQLAVQVRLQNPITDMSEEPRRQHSVIEAGRLDAWPGPQIGAGPEKIVGFGDDDPGWQVIQSQMGL